MINTKDLKKLLNESAINPNKPGPWKIIADIGQSNPIYLKMRAMELLQENDSDDNLRKAISMLLLARYYNAKARLPRVVDRDDDVNEDLR